MGHAGNPMADSLLRKALNADPVDKAGVAWVHGNMQEDVAELKREKKQLLLETEALQKETGELKKEVKMLKNKAEGPPHIISELKWAKEQICRYQESHEVLMQAREICLAEVTASRKENKLLVEDKKALQQCMERSINKVLEYGKRLREVVGSSKVD